MNTNTLLQNATLKELNEIIAAATEKRKLLLSEQKEILKNQIIGKLELFKQYTTPPFYFPYTLETDTIDGVEYIDIDIEIDINDIINLIKEI